MRNWIKNCTFVMLGLLGFKSTEAQAVDMFLCIDGVVGETASKSDSGCIDVLAWSWGASNSGGGGSPNWQDISLTKYADGTSTYFLSRVADGQAIQALQLRVRDSCCTQPITYQLSAPGGSLVSSLSTGGSGGENRLTENISLTLPSAEWCYSRYVNGEPDGALVCDEAIF